MIFVTVGTHNQGFERLIKKMDEISTELNDEVIIQTGHTEFKPTNVKWFKFKKIEEIHRIYEKANIIVAHAGAGTLIDALSFNKKIIVVPRLKKYNEHIDNQQIELAEALERSGKVWAVYDVDKLNSTIKKSIKIKNTTFQENKVLSKYIKKYLQGN